MVWLGYASLQHIADLVFSVVKVVLFSFVMFCYLVLLRYSSRSPEIVSPILAPAGAFSAETL